MDLRTASSYQPTALVQLERRLTVDMDRPVVVTVLPLDQRTSTSPVAAALATVLQSLSGVAVAAVDADGVGQPLRRILGSDGSGDLVGLAASHGATLRRRAVEDYVDMTAQVPLASCWLDGPGAVPPVTLRDAVWRLRRRFPSLVIDVPHGVPVPTIGTASDLASHVVLVGDATDIGHAWLHEGRSVVGRLAARGAVTVVGVGGDEHTRGACAYGDIVPMPPVRSGGDGAGALTVETVRGIGEVAARIFEAGIAPADAAE